MFHLFLPGNSVIVMTEAHEDISIIRHGDTLDVVFNRPEKRNALTPQMYDAIAGACRSADSDREIRLLTLRGAGERRSRRVPTYATFRPSRAFTTGSITKVGSSAC